jgi:hypothetical protein
MTANQRINRLIGDLTRLALDDTYGDRDQRSRRVDELADRWLGPRAAAVAAVTSTTVIDYGLALRHHYTLAFLGGLFGAEPSPTLIRALDLPEAER